MRTERDTLGEVRVPDDALYGAQTQRAVENYPISGLREHPVFLRAFVLLKKAAALANKEPLLRFTSWYWATARRWAVFVARLARPP